MVNLKWWLDLRVWLRLVSILSYQAIYSQEGQMKHGDTSYVTCKHPVQTTTEWFYRNESERFLSAEQWSHSWATSRSLSHQVWIVPQGPLKSKVVSGDRFVWNLKGCHCHIMCVCVSVCESVQKTVCVCVCVWPAIQQKTVAVYNLTHFVCNNILLFL